jgi:hypothetical protein
MNLTDAQRERLNDLAAMQPLEYEMTVDEELLKLGLVEIDEGVDDDPESVDDMFYPMTTDLTEKGWKIAGEISES